MSAIPNREPTGPLIIRNGIASIPAWNWDSTQDTILGFVVHTAVNTAVPVIPRGGAITPGVYFTFANGWVLALNSPFFESAAPVSGRQPSIFGFTYVGEANRTFDPTTRRPIEGNLAELSALESAIRDVAGRLPWTRDDLIAGYIQPNPYHPGIADAVVISDGVPVWALAGAVMLTGAEPEDVAHEYEIPLQAMYAALAYYQRHRAVIDARIAANDVGVA